MNHEYFMGLAYKEALKSYKLKEVPVGCIIVRNNEIISKGYNLKETKKNALLHAEIIAINKACEKLNTWRLDDCIMYVTLKPCIMCSGAILSSRINTLVYGASENKYHYDIENINFNHKINIIKNVLEEKCSNLLTDFFKTMRLEKND